MTGRSRRPGSAPCTNQMLIRVSSPAVRTTCSPSRCALRASAVGGALGAALAGSAWAWAGWPAVCGVALAFTGAAGAFGLLAERRPGTAAAPGARP
ncbi:hypothetical protein WM16_14265 [Burkholderia ubonensis]|uniref:Uncharacterized protein n=1 Tax=Burkholderia ubonensis TaxID=101571 RepID=A0A125JU93_9BURK|nr:hypothetical protein WJ35_10260 [Burkholderia ubonensis]KWK75431.1 hypothetical protein WM16_14265 [Burkholderia ubonensis]